MPERWQDELKKLRREEMPEGVRDRAEAGPRRDLPNDGRQRVIAGVVAFVVFIAAGAFAWRAFGTTTTTGTEPTPSPRTALIVLDLSSNDGNPAATLSSGDASQDGVREGYDWCGSDGQCVSGIADFSSYPPVSEYLFVPAGTPVELTGDGRIDDIATILSSGDGAPTHVQKLTLEPVTPSDPGRYVWMLDAKWDEGSANYYFGIEVAPPADQVPDVLNLTCSPVSATLESGLVQAQPDGVHIAVNASDDVGAADIVGGSTPEDFVGVGLDPREDGSRGVAIAPGSWSVGCYAGEGGGIRLSDIGSGRVATFTVVDSDGLYVEDALGCDVSDTKTMDVTGSVQGSDQNWNTIVADSTAAIPGLLPTDTVRDAGYPDGPGSKDGPHPVVIRDGSVIGLIQFQEFAAGGGAWNFILESCTGSGLGQGDVIEPTAVQAPNMAAVQCTADGTELDTPVVEVQADGLHVDATNETNAVLIDVELAEGGNLGSDAFDGSNHSEVALRVPPGRVLIACLFSNGSKPITTGSDAHPELYVPIEAVDPNGYFVPSAPACDSPERVLIATAGAGVLPSSDAIIRARVPGIRDDDVVERAGYVEGGGSENVWRVVRGGEVVAQILYPSEKGIACAGSGIGGA